MDEVTPKDAFEAFVVDNVDELRRAARLIGGDDATAGVLLDAALADTAARWASIRADDPVRSALEAIDAAAAASWDRDGEPSSADATPVALAARAWTTGRRRRGRRRRGVAVALTTIAVVVAAYLVSEDLDRPEPPDRNLSAERVYPLPDDRYLLPPPVLIRDTPTVDGPLTGFDDDPTPLTEEPLAAFEAAAQWKDGSITVVDLDGAHRVVDALPDPPDRALAERAIAPGGERLALRDGSDVVLVSVDGSIETVATSVETVVDVVWTGDASAIIVTGVDGSVLLDLATGNEEELPYFGSDVAVTPDSRQTREVTSPVADEPMVRIHGGTAPRREIPLLTTAPWAASWTGPPAIDETGGTLARSCTPDPRVAVPSTFGTPLGCVAVIDVSGRVEALLVLTDAHPPVTPTLLAVQRGRIVLAVGDDAAPMQRVLRWDPATGDVVVLARISSEATVALSPTPGRR